MISLTPLIDVVFILLVFFMLVSSFLREASLPLATPPLTTDASTSDLAPLVVEMAAPGTVRLEGDEVRLEALPERLGDSLDQRAGNRSVTLRVADDLPLQATVEALDAIRAAAPDAVNLRRIPR